MLAESQQPLTALTALAGMLQAVTDSLADEQKKIEALLDPLALGFCELTEPIRAPSDVEEHEEHGQRVTFRYESRLAYARIEARWGFTVRDYRGTVTDGTVKGWTLLTSTPLLHAPRAVRDVALPLIPVLLDVMLQMTKMSLRRLSSTVGGLSVPVPTEPSLADMAAALLSAVPPVPTKR